MQVRQRQWASVDCDVYPLPLQRKWLTFEKIEEFQYMDVTLNTDMIQKEKL